MGKNPIERLRNIRFIDLKWLGQCQWLTVVVPEIELRCPDSLGSDFIMIASCS